MSRKILSISCFLLACIMSHHLFGQTGPGGVQQTNGSSELVLWLDASTITANNGDEITSWTDLSGYNNNASSYSGNRPTYNSSWTNGRPSVSFTSSNSDYLYVANSSSTQLSQHEIYIVAEISSSSDSWSPLIVKADDYDWGNGYGIVKNGSSEEVLAYDNDYYYNYVVSTITYSTPTVLSHFYNGNKVRLRKNGSNQGTTNYSGGISNSTEPLYIGVSPYYSGSLTDFLDGNIAEIIVFNDNHNTVERLIVQNYLSAKYGISISGDRYAYQVNHGHELIGIGMRNSSSVSTAQGTGILEISNPSSLSSDDYLFIGHDGTDLSKNYSNVTNGYTYSINRVWRADKTYDVGTVSMSFDVTGLGFPTDGTEYAILIDTDEDFTDATVHTTGASYSGNEISFTGVNLSDGAYFTLAAMKSITWDGASFENGSGTANAPNSSDSERKFYVSGSGGSLTSDASVFSVVIDASAAITLNSNSELTVSNGIVNNGTLTISDGSGLNQTHDGANANSGSGSYVINRTGLGTVNGYNGVSSPIQSAHIPTIFSSNNPCDMFMFDGNLQLWKYDYTNGYTATCLGNAVTFGASHVISGGDGYMDVASGYFIPGNSSPTKTFTGEVNNGEVTTAIYQQQNPNNVNWTGDDWNLIGNPYPGAIDATAFWNENAVNNSRITNAIYFWDDDASSGSGYNQNDDYASWNLLGGTSSSNSSEIPNGYIASCQGFWVIANTSTNVVFNNSMRGGTNTQFFKQENNPTTARFWFSVENTAGDYNQLLIGFKSDATDGLDNAYDAIKYAGNPDLYMGSVINDDVYAIQGLPNMGFNESKEVELELFSNNSGLHTFKLDSVENSNYNIQLIDKVKNKVHTIENGIATIYLDSAGTYKDRFYLAVHNPLSTNTGQQNGGYDQLTSVNNLDNDRKIYAYQNENLLTINLGNTNSLAKQISLTNVSGKQVYSSQGSGNDLEYINVDQIATGIYILQVDLQNGTSSTHKININ